jgi:putative selenate reductase
VFNAPADYSVAALKEQYAFVILATGAWKAGEPPVKEGAENIVDALRFLQDSKEAGLRMNLGKRVAVIGGGDVAMDCARAAKRTSGVESVTVVYRRTRGFMPAQEEEIELALADGVEIIELLAPLKFADGKLTCEVMRLGENDSSGRRSVSGTGKKQVLPFDYVIGAVGARVDTSLFVKNGLPLNAKGCPELNAANESPLSNVYIAGDCKAGAATVVKAIADGKLIALDILSRLGIENDLDGTKHELPRPQFRPKARTRTGERAEGMYPHTNQARFFKNAPLKIPRSS